MTDSASDEIFSVISRVLSDLIGNEPANLTGSSTAASVPGWDSLVHVMFILNVESTLNVRFTSSEIAQVQSLGEFAQLVRQKRARQ